MTDALSKVAEVIAIARRTRPIVWQNIIVALGVKLIFIALGAIGVATLWEAVFADMINSSLFRFNLAVDCERKKYLYAIALF